MCTSSSSTSRAGDPGGIARDSARAQFDRRGVEAQVVALVCLLDRKKVQAVWSFEEDELSDEKVREFVAQVQEFSGESR